jgi:hypothetical protein
MVQDSVGDTLDDDLAAAASVRYAMSQTSFVMSYSGGGGLGPPHLGLVAFGFDREPGLFDFLEPGL